MHVSGLILWLLIEMCLKISMMLTVLWNVFQLLLKLENSECSCVFEEFGLLFICVCVRTYVCVNSVLVRQILSAYQFTLLHV
jgi:hypothetical protein